MSFLLFHIQIYLYLIYIGFTGLNQVQISVETTDSDWLSSPENTFSSVFYQKYRFWMNDPEVKKKSPPKL